MTILHTAYIEAAPEEVWAATVDVERWPDWMPTITSVKRLGDGPFRLGSVAFIKQPALPETPWTVTAFVPGRRFTWEARIRGLHMVATHIVLPDGDGTTNHLQLDVTGMLVWVLGPVLRRAMQQTLARENQCFKTRCEAPVHA